MKTHRPFDKIAPAMALALALLISPLASAQPAVDRSAIEEKRRQAEEKRKMLEELKKRRTRETSAQTEERRREEQKTNNRKLALTKAQEALQAASRRQNKRGMNLMHAAWMLDPTNMDYSFNAAAFAEATQDETMEFSAYAAFTNLAARELGKLGGSASAYKQLIVERMTKAKERMELLSPRFTIGTLTVRISKPDNCEISFDGAVIGESSGSITAIAGQHKVKTYCPGFYDIEQFANVRAGDKNLIVLRPKEIPYFGYLVVNIRPKNGVTVFLDHVSAADRLADKPTDDGKITGSGAKKDPFHLRARKWIIRFKKDGYDRWHRRITINRDQITVVNAVMERLGDTVENSGNK